MVRALFDLCSIGSRFPLETNEMYIQRKCYSAGASLQLSSGEMLIASKVLRSLDM